MSSSFSLVFPNTFFSSDQAMRGNHVSIKPDGGIELIAKGSHSPCLDTYVKKFTKFFRFDQDPGLLKVSDKIKSLKEQIHQRSGSDWECLKNQIHDHGHKGFYNHLLTNIHSLNARFERGNQHNWFTLLCLKVINMFRSLLRLSPLVFTKYELLDVQLLDSVRNEFFTLTASDRRSVTSSVHLTAGSAQECTSNNVNRLEMGLIESIRLPCGDRAFALHYSPSRRSFYLVFVGSASDPSLTATPTSTSYRNEADIRIVDAQGNRINSTIYYTSGFRMGEGGYFRTILTRDPFFLPYGSSITLCPTGTTPISFTLSQRTPVPHTESNALNTPD